MKKFLVLAAALVFAAAGVAIAQIANSKHDLSKTSTGATLYKADDETQVCVFCHIPHRATPAAGRPLWNHTLSTATLTWNPTTTARGTSLPGAATGLASAACLGCHDGTIALGDVITGTDIKVSGATTTVMTSASTAFVDPTTMSKNHPIGVPGPPADKDGFTKFVAVEPAGNFGIWYRGGNVECQSCHNPHLTTGVTYFLRKSNDGSAICKTCHST